MEHVNSGTAAFVILVNALASKVFMTVAWRSKLEGKSTQQVKNIKESPEFIADHSRQLNEAEWAPLMLAAFCYLNLKGVSAPVASGLAMFGCPWYMWGGKIIPKSGILGAIGRYAALGMLCWEFYKNI